MTSWPQNAYVGQKVVCVELINLINPWHRNIPLTIGAIYIIKELYIYNDKLRFVVNDGTPRFWLASQFRPVQSTEKGMSILKEILVTQNVKEDA